MVARFAISLINMFIYKLTNVAIRAHPIRCNEKKYCQVRHHYEKVLSPEERTIYVTRARILQEAATDGVTSEAAPQLDPAATCNSMVPYNKKAAAASLAPPSSVALWFQQPSLQPHQCVDPTRKVAAQLKSPHPISTASIDAVKPNCTQKDINAYHDEFKRETGHIPTAHPEFPKHVRYIKCCCELCRKTVPLPHAFYVGMGIIQAAQYKHKI